MKRTFYYCCFHELCVCPQSVRLPCVTGVVVPEGVQWKQVADYAMQK